MPEYLESVEHPAARTQFDKFATFASSVIVGTFTTAILAAAPVGVVATDFAQTVATLTFCHAMPLSAVLAAVLLGMPRHHHNRMFCESVGVLGGMTALLIVSLYAALGTFDLIPAGYRTLLISAPVAGAFFGAMAIAKMMQLARLAAVIPASHDEEDDEPVYRNPQSWEERTEGWTR